jgi:serine/threonine protein kinase
MRFKIIEGICEGLRYLHQLEIIHLDLKPDNILLDEKMVPKIVDFGISKLVGTSNTAVTKSPLGTM